MDAHPGKIWAEQAFGESSSILLNIRLHFSPCLIPLVVVADLPQLTLIHLGFTFSIYPPLMSVH